MISIAPYYKVRNLCHALKAGNPRAIQISANLLSEKITSADTIIPMPSHRGSPTYMLAVAEQIAAKTGCQVLTNLSSTPHQPWYDTKFKNGINTNLNYEFQINPETINKGTIYIIDNVCSTGKTMKAAIAKVQEMYPKIAVEGLVLGVVDNSTIQHLNYGPELHEGLISRVITETIHRYLRRNLI